MKKIILIIAVLFCFTSCESVRPTVSQNPSEQPGTTPTSSATDLTETATPTEKLNVSEGEDLFAYSGKAKEESIIQINDMDVRVKKLYEKEIKQIEVKEDEEGKKTYEHFLEYRKQIPSKHINEIQLDQEKEEYKSVVSRTEAFYDAIFYKNHYFDVDYTEEDNQKDKDSVKTFVELTNKYFEEDFLDLNFLEYESKVVEEDESSLTVRNDLAFISRGVMRPVLSTGISFFTIVRKKDHTIKEIYVNEDVESIRGRYLTADYDADVYEYSRDIKVNGYLRDKIDKVYQEEKSAFENGKIYTEDNLRIVDVIKYGLIVQYPDKKYAFLEFNYEAEGFISSADRYTLMLYAYDSDIITVYSEEKGLEFLDTVAGDIVLSMGKDYTVQKDSMLERFMINYSFNFMHGNIVVKNKNGKEGLIDLLGNFVIDCRYDKIIPINREKDVYEVWSGQNSMLIKIEREYDPDRFVISEVLGPDKSMNKPKELWIDDLKGYELEPSQAKLLGMVKEK